jgi:putative spermidine/putrescine transport system ATP-binding protein
MKGADVIVSVRPEHFRVQDEGESGQLSGIVKVVMPLGPQVIYDVEIPGGTGVKISQPRDASSVQLQSGSIVHFAPISPAACHIFPVQSEPQGVVQ